MKTLIAVIGLALSLSSFAAAQAVPAEKAGVKAPAKQQTKAPAKQQEAKAQPAVAKSTAAAQKDPAAEVIAALKAWDERLTSLKASFTQQVDFREAGLKQNVEGTLTYSRPNFLRIEHSKPAAQVIVTDKSAIWIYKPADKQAVKTSWEAWRSTQDQNFSGILDFGNYAALAEKNAVSVTAGEKGAPLTVTFTPRSGAPYALKLKLAADDLFPLEAELTVDNTVISTKLLNVQKNGEIDKEIFKFSPPKGTEVLKLDK